MGKGRENDKGEVLKENERGNEIYIELERGQDMLR